MSTIDFHGDDYGISRNNCIRFVELMKSGHIDSISIIPNMSYYEEGIKYLQDNWDSIDHKPLISVHLNIIDGYSLSDIDNPELTRLLDDGRRGMNASWGRLLLLSYMPEKKRRRIQSALSREIGAQIVRVYKDLPEGCGLRLDSHVHTHMIPIVFDAMMEAIADNNLEDKVEFVRVSREPLLMFLTTRGVAGTYSIINGVKNILLGMLSSRAERILRGKNISYGCLWGLIMTGRMDACRVSKVMPKMVSWISNREGRRSSYLEVLCHPGIVLDDETSQEYGEDDLHAFFSTNRDIEYQMLTECVTRE